MKTKIKEFIFCFIFLSFEDKLSGGTDMKILMVISKDKIWMFGWKMNVKVARYQSEAKCELSVIKIPVWEDGVHPEGSDHQGRLN